VSASRLTGDGKYTDKMVFSLTDAGGSCKIEACSESQVFSIGDAGTNYCNVKLLVCGSDQGCKVAKNDFTLGDETTSKKSQASVNMDACLAATTLTVRDTNLAPYPGYSGELSVTGTVGGYLYNNDAYIWYNVAGVEADCATAPEGVANACGIHIHEGKTCDDADSVGGHYYDGDSMSDDPWAPITYQASADGTTKGKTFASIGAGQDINGRAIVVHDKTGARVACALIEGKLSQQASCAPDNTDCYPGQDDGLCCSGHCVCPADPNVGCLCGNALANDKPTWV
jgi:hypothetical protein